jgi:hypothetical protein
MSVKAFKYIHKYIYKGHDRITMGFGTNQDEIKQFLDARYVAASEGTWRLYRYSLHEEVPNVVRLSVHLEDEQSAIFNENADPQEALNAAARRSTLMAFFKANADEKLANEGKSPEEQTHLACNLLYQEFPQKFTMEHKKQHLECM